ncbi:MAG TPA: hypothetical protein DCF63_16885 [Planctomycetaceae bacterium]|nr:hypothetical protein [Planctomycetaceae bacterium]
MPQQPAPYQTLFQPPRCQKLSKATCQAVCTKAITLTEQSLQSAQSVRQIIAQQSTKQLPSRRSV